MFQLHKTKTIQTNKKPHKNTLLKLFKLFACRTQFLFRFCTIKMSEQKKIIGNGPTNLQTHKINSAFSKHNFIMKQFFCLLSKAIYLLVKTLNTMCCM